MNHYAIRPGITPDTLPERIADAYRAGGLKPPNRSSELRERLAAEPTADQVAQVLAVESLTVANLDTWYPEAVDKIARAHAADALAHAVTKHREKALKDESGRMIAEALADLQKPAAASFKKLTSLAVDLPQGDAPFDLDGIVATDATKQAREAGRLLEQLAAFANVVGYVGSAADLAIDARAALLVVDIPEVPVNRINRLSRAELEPNEDRNQVKVFIRAAEKHGADAAIVNVSRGAYGPSITLSLIGSRTEARERNERARRASSIRPVDDWSTPAKSGKPRMQVKM